MIFFDLQFVIRYTKENTLFALCNKKGPLNMCHGFTMISQIYSATWHSEQGEANMNTIACNVNQ